MFALKSCASHCGMATSFTSMSIPPAAIEALKSVAIWGMPGNSAVQAVSLNPSP